MSVSEQQREQNGVACGKVSLHDGEDDWETYEELPARIRQAMWEYTYDCCSVHCRDILAEFQKSTPSKAKAEIDLLLRLQSGARKEIEDFAADYEAQHGTPYPHVAAGASIQRYHGDGHGGRK